MISAAWCRLIGTCLDLGIGLVWAVAEVLTEASRVRVRSVRWCTLGLDGGRGEGE